MKDLQKRIYIISNIHPSRHDYINSVCSPLSKIYKVFKPHVDNKYNLDNAKIEFSVFYKDKTEIDKADISLILMPLFGRDCAAEIGYSQGIGNCVIAYVEKMETAIEKDWLNDWMVKGFIDFIITPDTKTYNLLLDNQLIKHKSVLMEKAGKEFVNLIKNDQLAIKVKELSKTKKLNGKTR